MWVKILILRDWHATIAVSGALENKKGVRLWVGDFGAAFLLFPISIANSFAVYRAEIIPRNPGWKSQIILSPAYIDFNFDV